MATIRPIEACDGHNPPVHLQSRALLNNHGAHRFLHLFVRTRPLDHVFKALVINTDVHSRGREGGKPVQNIRAMRRE